MERAVVPGLERCRRVRIARALSVLSLLSLSQVPGAALAQINITGRGAPGIDLTKEDQEMLMEAGSRLRPEGTPIGKSETWSNPQSGNSGSVTLIERFRKKFQNDDLPCQKVRHDLRNTKEDKSRTYVIDVCRLPSGEWKIG
jgi:surface antigen